MTCHIYVHLVQEKQTPCAVFTRSFLKLGFNAFLASNWILTHRYQYKHNKLNLHTIYSSLYYNKRIFYYIKQTNVDPSGILAGLNKSG